VGWLAILDNTGGAVLSVSMDSFRCPSLLHCSGQHELSPDNSHTDSIYHYEFTRPIIHSDKSNLQFRFHTLFLCNRKTNRIRDDCTASNWPVCPPVRSSVSRGNTGRSCFGCLACLAAAFLKEAQACLPRHDVPKDRADDAS
jgi:hypothetical protein